MPRFPDDAARSRTAARRRALALSRACALGGVSLALLAPTAHGQAAPRDAAPASARDARATARPSRVAPPVRAGNDAAARVLGGGPAFGTVEANPFGLAPYTVLQQDAFASPALGDLDGDGALDVLAAGSAGLFSRSLQTPDPTTGAVAFGEPEFDPYGLSGPSVYLYPTLGDLDGDGDLDLVTANNNDAGFTFFENTAAAGAEPLYGAPQNNPFGLFPSSSGPRPLLTDLDGDGDLDLLAGLSDGTFAYYPNTGTASAPTFGVQQTNPFNLSYFGDNARPAVGDLDGDGDLDVLVGNKSGSLTYYENVAGAGATPSFAGPVSNPFGLTVPPPDNPGPIQNVAPAIGDLDGDGDLDVVVGRGDGSFVRFENTTQTGNGGQPTFTLVNPSGLDPVQQRVGESNVYPIATDLDADGDLDLLVGGESGAFAFFENTAGPGATPAFGALQQNPFGLSDFGQNLQFTVGDLDGDGDLDVLANATTVSFPSLVDRYAVFENTAGPGATPAFGPPQFNPGSIPPSGSDEGHPLLVDLDGDGDLDLVSREEPQPSGFAYRENTAPPGAAAAFGPVQRDPFGITPSPGFDDLTLGDFDGDGDLDLLRVGPAPTPAFGRGGGQGQFELLENTADPGALPAFGSPQRDPFGLPLAPSEAPLVAADLDGDGDLDVLTGDAFGGGFVYFENAGTAGGPLQATLDGPEGYRMLAAPGATPLATLFGTEIYSQGFPDATDPRGQSTVFVYDETQPGSVGVGYAPPTSLNAPLGAGRGAFVYVYEDEDPRPTAPGTQGGFPKTLRATGTPATVRFAWGAGGDAPLSFTDTGSPADDGWNLLGNPFGSWFDWDAVELSGVNAPVYVYDGAAATYLSHTRGIPGAGSLPGGIVGPFQGFWAQANAAGARVEARPALSNGGPLYRGAEAPTVVRLRLRPADGSPLPATVRSEAFLALGVDGAQDAVSPLDALALLPPAPSYVLLATEALRPDGTPAALAIDARPAQAASVTVELSVAAVANGAPVGTDLVLDWPGLALPDGWQAQLVDRTTGAVVALQPGGSYPFAVTGPTALAAPDALAPPAPGAPQPAHARTDGRFALLVTPAGIVSTAGDAATPLALSAARPNPTAGGAALVLTLPEAADATVAVYDALGRRVALLASGPLGAGPHTLRLAPGLLSAGTYVVRADVGGQVLTQRLTVTR